MAVSVLFQEHYNFEIYVRVLEFWNLPSIMELRYPLLNPKEGPNKA